MSTPSATTVDLTPAAFTGPGAQAAIDKANKAAGVMQDAIRQKAEFLRVVIDDHFGGIDNLCKALTAHYKAEHNRKGPEYVEEVREEFNRLNEMHESAGVAMFEALQGK